MKHDDTTLQAAIDAAMLETKTGTGHNNLDTYQSIYWHRESPARLALAKAFLAKLPEAQPTLADDGRSLGRIAHEAFIGAPGSRDDWMNAAAQAVANVVLAQAIRRMEAVPVEELDALWNGIVEKARPDTLRESLFSGFRARLIAAARGEADQQADGIDWKARAEKAEAEVELLKKVPLRQMVEQREREVNHWCDLHAIAYNRSEKAEAELAALKSSSIGILRPLSEAGPVPDGCVRVKGHKCTENDWCLAHWENRRNTHFADIRLPSKETPAQDVTEAADPYARIKAYAKAGARIRLDGEYVRTDWTSDKKFPFWLSPEKYEVHPDDLHLVPEYAPVNEQPKQQVPLGPEDVMPGSVIQGVSSPSWHWISVVSVHQIQAKLAGHCGDIGTDRPTWEELKLAAKINRSIPLTGKWDANAWEPCCKLI